MPRCFEVRPQGMNPRHDKISVTMTLTTPNCPSGEWIYEGVNAALQGVAPGKPVEVALVFDPA